MHLADFLAVNQQPSTALVFVVPMPPNVTNRTRGSTHWRRAWREKHEYWNVLNWLDLVGVAPRGSLFEGCVIPPAPPRPFAAVTISSAMTVRGEHDDDNAVARHKYLIDWLARNGYIASDRRTCVRWAAFPTQTVSRKQPARITLTLTPRSET
jgi:hypothetical protein